MKGILAKIFIFIINFVLWICGILLIVFGSIGLADETATINMLNLITGVSNVTNLMNVMPFFEGVSIFMIVLGCLLFLFGGIGCCGAFRMHKRTIMNYWIMLILGVLCEIALIIYAAVFPPTQDSYIVSTLTTSLNKYFEPVTIATDGTITYSANVQASSWELLQSQSQCCGANGPDDYAVDIKGWKEIVSGYGYPNATVPPSCCINNVNGKSLTSTGDFTDIKACLGADPTARNFYYNTACSYNVETMVWQFNYIAIIIASCLMATQLIGIALSVHVWHKMVREDGSI